MKVEFHPQAEEEFIEAALFYEREVPGLGDAFIDELDLVTDLIQKHPELGEKQKSHCVICRCSVFPTR